MMKTHLFVLPVVRLVRCVKYADWERAKNSNKQTTDLKAIFEVMEFLLIFTHQIKSTFFFSHILEEAKLTQLFSLLLTSIKSRNPMKNQKKKNTRNLNYQFKHFRFFFQFITHELLCNWAFSEATIFPFNWFIECCKYIYK